EVRRAHRAEPPLVAVVTHCDCLEPKGTRLHRADDELREDVEEKMRHVAAAERAVSHKLDTRPRLRDRHVATLGVSAYMSWRNDAPLRADERGRTEALAVPLFRPRPDRGRAELARATQARAVQEELATTLTKATAAICAGIAAAPIPVADVVPLTTLQASLGGGVAGVGGGSVGKRGGAEILAGPGANAGAALVLRGGLRALTESRAPVER